MSTLKEKAEQILQEKEDKITPGEFLDTNTIFGISGNFGDERESNIEAMEYPQITDTPEEESVLVVSNISNDDIVVNSMTNIESKMGYSELAQAIGLTDDILKDGSVVLGINGTVQEGIDTSDATAEASDIIEGQTAYVDGNLLTGSLRTHIDSDVWEMSTNNFYAVSSGGNVSGYTATKWVDGKEAIADGQIDMTVPATAVEQTLGLTAGKIKAGEKISNITGTYAGLDTSDATATVNDITRDKSAYVNGQKITGNIRTVQTGLDEAADLKHLNFNEPANKLEVSLISASPGSVVLRETQALNMWIPANDVASAISLTANKIKKDESILGITGTYEGLDTSDATATTSDILFGQTAYVDGEKIVGEIPTYDYSIDTSAVQISNIEDNSEESVLDMTVSINSCSYENGVFIEPEEEMPTNIPYTDLVEAIGLTEDIIKQDETVLGVTGTYQGESATIEFASNDNAIIHFGLIADAIRELYTMSVQDSTPIMMVNSDDNAICVLLGYGFPNYNFDVSGGSPFPAIYGISFDSSDNTIRLSENYAYGVGSAKGVITGNLSSRYLTTNMTVRDLENLCDDLGDVTFTIDNGFTICNDMSLLSIIGDDSKVLSEAGSVSIDTPVIEIIQ